MELQLEFLRTEFNHVSFDDRFMIYDMDGDGYMYSFSFENGIWYDCENGEPVDFLNEDYQKFIREKRNEKLKILLG